MQNNEVIEQIKQNEKQALILREFELSQINNLIQMIQDQGWDNIDFQILLKNPNHIQIKKFKFKDCLDDDIIDALKKIIKLGFERALKKKNEQIKKLKEIL